MRSIFYYFQSYALWNQMKYRGSIPLHEVNRRTTTTQSISRRNIRCRDQVGRNACIHNSNSFQKSGFSKIIPAPFSSSTTSLLTHKTPSTYYTLPILHTRRRRIFSFFFCSFCYDVVVDYCVLCSYIIFSTFFIMSSDNNDGSGEKDVGENQPPKTGDEGACFLIMQSISADTTNQRDCLRS